MTYQLQTVLHTPSSDRQTLLINIVHELVETCCELRPLVVACAAHDCAPMICGVLLKLEALCERCGSSGLGFVEVEKAVRRELQRISEVFRSALPSEERSAQLYAHYLGLENIPSQLTAALEQAHLTTGRMRTRYQLINDILRLRKGASYLEIGCCNDDCFKQVQSSQKVGVDPNSGGTLRMTSDEFFAVNQQYFDLIFIDGLHEAAQVDKDIVNALRWSSDNGMIVLHDCNPLFEIRAVVPRIAETWNGDVWKSLVRVRSRLDLDCATGTFDHGCAVICKRPNSAPIKTVADEDLTWPNLQANRSAWLRTMPYDDLVTWLSR